MKTFASLSHREIDQLAAAMNGAMVEWLQRHDVTNAERFKTGLVAQRVSRVVRDAHALSVRAAMRPRGGNNAA
jgi:hypothetical protein